MLVVIGCPSPSVVLGALQLLGLVASIFLTGLGLIYAWEVCQDRLARRLREQE